MKRTVIDTERSVELDLVFGDLYIGKAYDEDGTPYYVVSIQPHKHWECKTDRLEYTASQEIVYGRRKERRGNKQT